MAFLVTLLLAGASLVALYKYLVYPAFLSPLAKVPAANFCTRISTLWISYIRWRNVENRAVLALHAKHGPIVLLGPNEVSINCYEGGLKTVYGGGFAKTDFYPLQFAFYGVPNMFSTAPSEPHSIRKRMVSHTYSKSALLSSPSLRATTRHMLFARLMPILSLHAASGEPLEVLRLAHAYSMDSFTAFQFGLPQASRWLLDEGERNWYLKNWMAIRPYVWWLTEAPTLMRILRDWLNINVIPKTVLDGLKQLEDWNLAKCDGAAKALSSPCKPANNKEQGGSAAANHPTIFATLLAHFQKHHGPDCYSLPLSTPSAQPTTHANNPRPRPVLELASEMFDHNAAAMETSGLTLTWLLYELSLRPHLQRRLRAELLTLSPPMHYHKDASGESPQKQQQQPLLPDPKQLDALPLLDAVIRETLRLWPAVSGRQPREIPGEGAELAGCAGRLPAGVRVQAYAYVLHRTGEVFAEPEVWKPERWMMRRGKDKRAEGEGGGEEEESEKRRLADMRRWFWAFGSGSRACIGQHFAWNEEKDGKGKSVFEAKLF
ncbi:Cytochrome P450 [Macrophomina phaseolina MS6]|uniref:Cytochrome P450 n=1 Tax=Macrophomina phaseolina (strain MS6) TaxID=1126212 RepID=K2RLI2_MACPH|nr:Cytochrome P450 [Macrophomina phaseolina MS6]